MLILFLTCGVEFKNLFPKFDCHVSSSFSARATVMNIFRVPLNLIVITLLFQVCLRALQWISLLFFNQTGLLFKANFPARVAQST